MLALSLPSLMSFSTAAQSSWVPAWDPTRVSRESVSRCRFSVPSGRPSPTWTTLPSGRTVSIAPAVVEVLVGELADVFCDGGHAEFPAEAPDLARFWLQVFSELKNRGVEDVLIAVCDGLKGLPEAITTAWERTVVQQCIVHLIRNSFRYAGRQHRDGIVKALKPVYAAPSERAAKDRFAEFTAEWGQRYPAIVRLWESSWAEFVPFLEYDVEIRRVICTTNAIESINARYRRAVRARGHFPNEAAALKCLYLVTRALDPTGGGRARWVMRWKPALNAFAITFAGRFERTTH